jgi:hypothetical protein
MEHTDTAPAPAGSSSTAKETAAQKRARRMRAAEAGVVRQARLLPGGDAVILNISNTGLLVENKSRLPIGSAVNVRVQGASVMGIEGHIVRSRVSAIHRDGSMSYETAIEFERPHSIDGEGLEESPPTPAAESSSEGVYVLDTGNDW